MSANGQITESFLECRDGTFYVDWRAIHRLVRSSIEGQQLWTQSRKEKIEWDSWFDRRAENAGLLPEVWTYETDWKKIRRHAKSASIRKTIELRNTAHYFGMAAALRDLQSLKRDGHVKREDHWKRYQELTHDNYVRREDKIDTLGTVVKGLTITRDLSADVFVICSGFVTGGAGWAALGMGAAGKGVFKYQDTGSVGSALIEAGGTVVFARIPVKIGATSGAKKYAVVVLAEAPLAGVQTLVEGKDLKDAAIAGGVKVAGSLMGDVFNKIPGLTDTMEKVSVPVRINATQKLTELQGQDMAGKVVDMAAGKLTSETIAIVLEKDDRTTPIGPGALVARADVGCLSSFIFTTGSVQALNSTAGQTLRPFMAC